MQFEAWMTRQPTFNDRMLMGGVIIQNDVDALAQRNFAVDLLENSSHWWWVCFWAV